MKLTIRPQRYPCYDGSRPLTFAIYHGHTFLAYSWSLAGAWVALEYLRRNLCKQS